MFILADCIMDTDGELIERSADLDLFELSLTSGNCKNDSRFERRGMDEIGALPSEMHVTCRKSRNQRNRQYTFCLNKV